MDVNDTDTALVISVVSLAIAFLALLWNILHATLLDRARRTKAVERLAAMVDRPLAPTTLAIQRLGPLALAWKP